MTRYPMHRAAKEPVPMAMPAVLSVLAVLLLWTDHGRWGLLSLLAGLWWAVAPFTFRVMVGVLAHRQGVTAEDQDEAMLWHVERFLPALEKAFATHWLMGPLLVRTDEEERSFRGRVLRWVSWTNWGMAIWPLWAGAIEKAVRTARRWP